MIFISYNSNYISIPTSTFPHFSFTFNISATSSSSIYMSLKMNNLLLTEKK